jgi:endonuclease-8
MAGERLAVCFNAPVVRLLNARQIAADPVLGLVGSLGPDLLSSEIAPVSDIVTSIRRRYSTLPVGDVLLDQSIASGIGNIYRCETLFVHKIDPATPVGQISDATLGSLYETARELLSFNARSPVAGRRFGRDGQTASVYDRAGLPCRACGTSIAVRHFGRDARLLFWCPTCQPPFATVRDQTWSSAH